MDISVNKKFEELLGRKDFFALRYLLRRHGSELPRSRVLYYGAFCESVFDNTDKSNAYIDEFFGLHADRADDETKAELLKIKADNLMRLYRYSESAALTRRILTDYAGALDDKEKGELQNNLHLWQTVADVPEQSVKIETQAVIPCARNSFNHLIVEVGTQAGRAPFIFDTGANLSTISESYAQKLGMSIREASVEVNTSTGMKLRTRMAVADKFDVGGLEFENVVFLVLPDDQLAFEEVGYSIKGIVGFPIIHQMRELRIGREHITIPSKPTPSHLGNLCLEGLMPVIKARARDEELIFTFDTGATRSELSRRYFDRHRQWIESEGELLTARRGGGGGMVDAENYFIDDFTLEIGTAEVTLPQIGVSLENYLFNEDKDGNMGQDVFMRFDETVICFEYMYVDLMNYENGSRDGEAGKTGMEQETLSEPSDIIDNSVCG